MEGNHVKDSGEGTAGWLQGCRLDCNTPAEEPGIALRKLSKTWIGGIGMKGQELSQESRPKHVASSTGVKERRPKPVEVKWDGYLTGVERDDGKSKSFS